MTVRAYSDYQESGIDWLAGVPRQWELKPLKQVAQFINGEAFKPSDWCEEGVPIIRIQNLNGGAEFNYFSGVVEEKYHVSRSDLLFGWSGNRGTSFGPFVWNGRGLHYLNQHIFRVLPKNCNILWLYWCLKAVTIHVEEQAHGIIGMVHVTKGELGAIKIPLPSAFEQTAIATFLDRETGKIDALVAEQERLIALLKEKRQAVISHAVTKGLNPNAPMKNSGVPWLGEVPADWEIKRLGSILYETAESGENSLPILSVSIHDGVSDRELTDDELDRKVARSEDRTKYKSVLPGDLAYNMMRAWQGGFGTVMVAGMVSPAYVVARPRQEIRTQFIELVLRTPNAITEMHRYSKGVTDFRLRLYWEEFKQIRVALPTLLDQDGILSMIKKITRDFDDLSAEATRAIALLRERRAALISAAVTGKIDVRDTVPATQDAA